MNDPLKVVGLFAGIGGIEIGLSLSGHETVAVCEIDPAARSVLADRMDLDPSQRFRDVTAVKRLPPADLVAAGFPCQDLSQAGRKAGIRGDQSSLVGHVFRLIDKRNPPSWLLFENVSYMLKLDKGRAMAFLVEQLESRGYSWAYRVVDARSFGVAQRRQRVILLASNSDDPRSVLFADESRSPEYDDSIGEIDGDCAYGWYWTEGTRGLGWTRNAVPTVKGGSRLGIPSPPAIWIPRTGTFGTPTIQDAEALQGFDRGWTAAAEKKPNSRGARWHLVGNAVCVPMAEWIGARLRKPGDSVAQYSRLASGRPWPTSACGRPGEARFATDLTMRPMVRSFSIEDQLADALKPLSAKATRGFLSRAHAGKLRFSTGFLQALEDHLADLSETRVGAEDAA